MKKRRDPKKHIFIKAEILFLNFFAAIHTLDFFNKTKKRPIMHKSIEVPAHTTTRKEKTPIDSLFNFICQKMANKSN